MAISLDMLQRGTVISPFRGLIYGPQGIGKTSLACQAPNPLLLQIEEGAGTLDVQRTPRIQEFSELTGWLDAIGTSATKVCDTLVLDTLDATEPLVQAEACARHQWASIETPGFGKGYVEAMAVWRELLDRFERLRMCCGISVIYLAHARVNRYDAPDTEAYDRYQIKLQDAKSTSAGAMVQEHVDCVLFNNWRVSVLRDQGRGDKKGEGRARGVGGGQRVIYTQERPAFLAKNRFGMPNEISLPDSPAEAWRALAQHIPYFNQSASAAA